MNTKELTSEEERIIAQKATELPFSGKYDDFKDDGVYTCKRCGALLYDSRGKFDAHCGWPSFDDEAPGAVERIPDVDGKRTEIACAACGAHLGHVFFDEGFTPNNTRHCVNSLSMNFIPRGECEKRLKNQKGAVSKPVRERAIFAGGCFWGLQHLLGSKEGILETIVGYTGGWTEKPTYADVCAGETDHAEAVEVCFDPALIPFEELCRYFFEVHDPTQEGMQGPDVGQQYRSAVFYTSGEQKRTAEKLIRELEAGGYEVATRIEKAARFWKAEDYHQHYYDKTDKTPSCHVYTKRF